MKSIISRAAVPAAVVLPLLTMPFLDIADMPAGPASAPDAAVSPEGPISLVPEASVAAGSIHELQVAGVGGVPADASAVALNLTAVDADGVGYVTAFPCGEPLPTASSLNFGPGQPVAGSAIVKLGAAGKVCLFTGDAGTELIADVNGWFPAGSAYGTQSPQRILDTRAGASVVDGIGSGEGQRAAGSTYELQVAGRGGVPGDASAVVLNLTAADAGGVGYVTAFACGEALPTASNLNFGPGQPVANSSIVKLGADGKVCLFTGDAGTELIADVNGWFPAGSAYATQSPQRILDTRAGGSVVDGIGSGEGQRAAGSTYELQVAGRGGVPGDASAVVLNLTAADAGGVGYVTAFPCGEPLSTASNLNFGPGQPVANSAIVKLGAGGKVCLFTGDAGTELIADVNGWFPAGSDYAAQSPVRLLDTRTLAPAPSVGSIAGGGSGAAFFEDFSGDTGLENFRTGVFHRERDAFDPPHPDWVSTDAWLADHDPRKADCGDPTLPENHHPVSTANGDASSFFVCKEHMMTTMGDVSGYSVVWFSPNQTFSSISKVCWDVNLSTDLLGHRQWWEVAVEPAGAPDASAIDWLAGTANLPSYGAVGATVLGFGPDNPPFPKISVGDTVTGSGEVPNQYRGDLKTRIHQCFEDLGNNTLRYTSYWPDGSEFGHWDVPGSFPSGDVKVVFKDHNYTPDKDCETFADGLQGAATCRSYTWHWDNIEVQT